jgi:hypothetical protein
MTEFANGKLFRYAVRPIVTVRWRRLDDPPEEAPRPPVTEHRDVKVEDIYAALVECVRRLDPNDVPAAYKIAFGYDPPPRPPKRCKTCGQEEK